MTEANETTTMPADAAERLADVQTRQGAIVDATRAREPVLDVEDLNFIERAVYAFACHEELATAGPKERVLAVMDRAMARVTPFLLERRERLSMVQPAGQRG